jgi:hypothetical protein
MALRFGTDESIHCIVDVGLKAPNGDSLCLAYKTSIRFFGAGVYLRDEGYVLAAERGLHHYYSMPDEAELKQFQEAGLLPNPLPTYSVSLVDYAFGYSLWIVLAVAVTWEAGKRLLRRSAPEGAMTPREDAPIVP